MASIADELSTLSLYKYKGNSISSLTNQIERRRELLKRQKEKREEVFSQLRYLDESDPVDEKKTRWPPRRSRRPVALPCPIDMMFAEWLFNIPEDLSSWFVIPCPRGQRCLVIVHSHRTFVYNKHGNVIRTIQTNLPRQTILYCIYDHRSSIYHILDLIMWNGQDYSTQVECQCRFFMLMSLEGDRRLNQHFQILLRTTVDQEQWTIEAEDGYLFYHPLGFYECGYSPLVCWLKPFMIEDILHIQCSYPIVKPVGYTTSEEYMFNEQSERKKDHLDKSQRKNDEEFMSMD